jgi:hypothetical protein
MLTATEQQRIHAWIYVAKTLRSACCWTSAWMAAKVMEASYIERRYQEKVEAPSPSLLITYAAAFDVLTAFVLVGSLAGAMYAVNVSRPAIAAFTTLAALDVLLDKAYVTVILLAVAGQVENKKYFNYRYEGLRAIRALREITFKASAFSALAPTYAVLSRRVLAA